MWLAASMLKALHLAAVDLAAAGPLASVLAEWWGRRRGDAGAEAAGRRVAAWSVAAFWIGAALGGALVALLWLGGDLRFAAAWQRLTAAKLWFAAAELLFFAGCMALYTRWWDHWPRARSWQRLAHRALAVAASTNLLYHFPPLFVMLAAVSSGGGDVPQTMDAAAYRRLLVRGDVLSLALHHVAASLALAGIALAVAAVFPCRRTARTSDAPAASAGGARVGAALALVATAAQLPLGVWVLIERPERELYLGGNLLVTALFIAALVPALGLLHYLAAVALGEATRPAVARAAALLASVVVLMVLALDLARSAVAARSGVTRSPPTKYSESATP
jgi:hypothetical protein